jgi:hypothetical protein
MQFSRIQNPQSNKPSQIERYYLDGKRVTEETYSYNYILHEIKGYNFNCFLTTKLRNEFYTSKSNQ